MSISLIRCLFILFLATSLPAQAVETAERISDREIIERLTQLEEGQSSLDKRIDDLTALMNQRFDDADKSTNRRFDDMNRRFDDLNARFSDVMTYLQILTGTMLVVGAGILGWLIIIWRKLVRVEERQSRFETQDDEIKFLKEAYNRLNQMVIKLMDALRPPKDLL